MNNQGIALTIEQYAEQYAKLDNEALLREYASESWAADRCTSDEESRDSRNSLTALWDELLKRMSSPK